MVKETVKIDSVSYDTLYSYDAMDRQATMTYPGGEIATTSYNVRGVQLANAVFRIGDAWVETR
jgi:hypothetical protein